jgi:hypothetical protein
MGAMVRALYAYGYESDSIFDGVGFAGVAYAPATMVRLGMTALPGAGVVGYCAVPAGMRTYLLGALLRNGLRTVTVPYIRPSWKSSDSNSARP